MLYVVLMDQIKDRLPTRVRLIGPFDNTTEAMHWVTDPYNPCWQMVDLDAPKITVEEP